MLDEAMEPEPNELEKPSGDEPQEGATSDKAETCSGVARKLERRSSAPAALLATRDGASGMAAPASSYADTLRAMGTAANVTGSIAPAVASVVAPLSAVGGVCGTVGGAYQLMSGLSMPSGKVDPHLVAKGGVTASVGTLCASLGLCAAAAPVAAPGLLFTALGLGMAGLGTATYLDANMDGLCQKCRGTDDSSMKSSIHEAWAAPAVKKLGITVRFLLSGKPQITQIAKGSWAEDASLAVGDVITKMNDTNVSDLSKEAVFEYMQNRPLWIQVQREDRVV